MKDQNKEIEKKANGLSDGSRFFSFRFELADKTLSGGRKPPEFRSSQGAYAPRSGSFVR
jgi:hypothetical protein